jgi:uncharacterized protein YabE (DUF348 family)
LDRPQWTQPEPQSWFDGAAPAGGATRRNPDAGPAQRNPEQDVPAPARWRPVSELTDTAWRSGAWHDPQAPWNVAAGPADAADPWATESDPADPWATGTDTGWTGTSAGEPGWNGTSSGESGWNGAPAGEPAWNGTSSGEPGWNGAPAGERAWNGTSAGEPAWNGTSAGEPGWNGTPAGESGWNPAGWNAAGAPTDAAWMSSVDEPGAVAVLDRPALDEPAPDEPAPERRHAVRHPLRLGLFALVLFGLVAGSVAWMSMDKSVQLRVDGEARSIKTYASTVGGVLDDQKITVGAHDTLAPGREAKVSDGSEIVLRRGRLVTLTVDGKARQVWTTATTVQEALEQVGYRQNGMFVSANRSTRLPLDGYQLTLRMPKTITIVADGKKHTITTTVPTVGEAMDAAGVTVDGDDRVSQLSGATLRAGMTITVTRVLTKSSTTQAVVEYKTVEKTDPKAAAGSRTVKTKGVNGLQEVTRVQTYVNGKLTSSKIAKVTVLKKPVDEQVVVGPEPPAEEAPPPSQPAECADFPTSGGLNWCGLAKCESGLNPSAYNPAGPYYGLYQFDQQTWTANGGAGSPSGKSIAEQTAVAYTLYQARGAAPWPVCGRNL